MPDLIHQHALRSDAASLLLVDDDLGAIQATGRMLTQYPDRRFATSGQAALRLARERTPDLVLLDADMPGLSGFDVYDALRADPELAQVPVIFATSHDAEALELAALGKGAADFVAKPLVAAQLTARVRAQLRVHHLMTALRRRYPAALPGPAASVATRPPRILIVDDDVASIRIVCSSLDGLGEFFFAEGGLQALTVARRIDPDLILLDAQMPEVDGFAVCQALKADSAFRYVPVVFMTRFADPRIEMRALDLGAADFVAKPYAATVLRARVRNLLAFKRLADAELEAARTHWRRNRDARAIDVLEGAGDAIVAFDADERVVVFNAAACRLFGVDSEQVLGASIRALLPSDVDVQADGPDAVVRRRITRADGAAMDVDVVVSHCGEGRQRLTTLTLHSLGAGAGPIVAARATDNDRLLAHLTREMHNALHSLIGHARLMADDRRRPLEAEQARRLDQVMAAARQLCDLRRDVLDFSSFVATRSALPTGPVNAAKCVAEANALVQPLAERAAVTVVHGFGEAMPFVLADAPRLMQCLLNLLGNAIHYNRPGGWVKTRLARSGDVVAIEVHDSGLGLSAEQRGHLFEPFNRLGREMTSVAGAGLALAITRGLVEAMHGTLHVESQPGKGSCFTIRLPALPDTTHTGMP